MKSEGASREVWRQLEKYSRTGLVPPSMLYIVASLDVSLCTKGGVNMYARMMGEPLGQTGGASDAGRRRYWGGSGGARSHGRVRGESGDRTGDLKMNKGPSYRVGGTVGGQFGVGAFQSVRREGLDLLAGGDKRFLVRGRSVSAS